MAKSKDESWRQEWVWMPEFVQEKQVPFSKIIIRCETEEDLKDLSRLLGQKLTAKTKSIWHPARSHWGNGKRRYKDEQECEFCHQMFAGRFDDHICKTR